MTEEQREKQRIRSRRWYLKNKERMLQKARENPWHKRNPEASRQATRRYRAAHPEWVKAMAKQHRANRRQKAIAESREYYRLNKDRERVRRREYNKTHRQQILDKLRGKYATDIHHRLRWILRARMHDVLNGIRKTDYTMKLVGCSPAELRAHLEKQFAHGMTWDNYGLHGWHVDHIRPCATFDLTDPEQQRQCFHYTNLQPLWAQDNYAKNTIRRKR